VDAYFVLRLSGYETVVPSGFSLPLSVENPLQAGDGTDSDGVITVQI
jgi:hypothetical protein